MAMTKPKSSQIEHRGETVQKVIDDITQQDGVLTADPSWGDVPKLKGANANRQAQALANRTDYLLENAAIKFIGYNDLRSYRGTAQSADITKEGVAGRFYCQGVVAGSGDDGGTKILDALGRLWVRSYSENVKADWFGFSKSGTHSQNSAAISAAVLAANGQEVIIDSDSDFNIGSLNIVDSQVNLVFSGNGKAVTTGVTLTANYSNVLDITSLDTTTITLDGNPGVVVTKVGVGATQGYARGDIVKVVSDDVDPAAQKPDRKRGEFCVVAYVDSSYIYLSAVLEDFSFYTTNPRIAKASTVKISVKGLRVKSNLQSKTTLVRVVGAVYPHVEIDVENHGRAVLVATSCYMGDFYPSGSGVAEYDGTSGDLGYLFNDIGGHGNKVHHPRGKFFRHVTTTNNIAAVDMDSVALYGPCRYHTVLHGVAETCMGAPWDDHEGARYSKWVSCSAFKSLKTASIQDCGFQFRGKDSICIDPYVDESYEAAFAIGISSVEGEININGGRWTTRFIFAVSGTREPTNRLTINITNSSCDAKKAGDTAMFFNAALCPENTDIHFFGGSYKFSDIDRSNFQIATVANGASVKFLDSKIELKAKSAVSGRLFALTGSRSESIVGKINLKIDSNISFDRIFQGGGNCIGLVKATVNRSFAKPSTIVGTSTKAKYVITFADGESAISSEVDFDGALDLIGI